MTDTFTIQIKGITQLESWFARAGTSAAKFQRTLADTQAAALRLEQAQLRATKAAERYGQASLKAAAAQTRLTQAQRSAGAVGGAGAAGARVSGLRFTPSALPGALGAAAPLVGGKVGGVLSGVSTGATIGAALGPWGAAAGGVIGGALTIEKLFDHGKSIGQMLQEIDAKQITKVADQAERLARANNANGLRDLANDAAGLRTFSDEGAKGLARLQRQIERVTRAADARNIRAFGRALAGLDKGPRWQTAGSFAASVMPKLDRLDPLRRRQAGKQTVDLAHSLEAEGRLPEGATDRLIKRLESRWDILKPYLASVGRASNKELARTLGDERVARAVQRQSRQIRSLWGDAPNFAKTSAGNARRHWVEEMDFLRQKMRSADPEQRAAARRLMTTLGQLGEGAARASKRAADRVREQVKTGWESLNQYLRAHPLGGAPAGAPSARVPRAIGPGGRPVYASGGWVPAFVSPGEQVVYGSAAWTIPGPRVPADNVFTMLPAGSAVLTAHGQQLAASGMPLEQVVANQLPHFSGGGKVSKLRLRAMMQPWGVDDAFQQGFQSGLDGSSLYRTPEGLDSELFRGAVSGVMARKPRSASSPGIGAAVGGGLDSPGTWHAGVNTLSWGHALAQRFGLGISSGYRSPAHNAAVGGVPNSLHTHGSPGNPGAIDFTPPSSAALAYVRSHGAREALIHDVGSGMHLHVGFFRGGGKIGKRIASIRGAATGDGAEVTQMMRGLAGALTGLGRGAVDKIARLEGQVRNGIKELAHGGVSGGERVQVRRLRGVLTLLDAQMGRRLGQKVAAAQGALDAVGRAQGRAERSRAIRGVPAGSLTALRESAAMGAEQLSTLRATLGDQKQRTGLFAALDKARKQHKPEAARAIIDQINSMRESIGQLEVDQAENQRQAAQLARYQPLDLRMAQAAMNQDDPALLAAMKDREALLEQDYANATTDDQRIELANQIADAKESIKSLDEQITQQNELAQQRMELDRQLAENQSRLLAVATSQPNVLLGAIVSALNGQIGGMVGLGAQTPGYAGGTARY